MKRINPFVAGLVMLLITALLIYLFEPGITTPAEVVAIPTSFAAFLILIIMGLVRIIRFKS